MSLHPSSAAAPGVATNAPRRRPPAISLRARLVLLVLVPVLPILAIILQSAAEHRGHLLDEAKGRALAVARAWSEHHEALVREAKAVLAAAERVDPQSPRCAAELRAIELRALWASTVAIIDEKGKAICASDPAANALEGLDPAYLDDVFQTRTAEVSEFRRTAGGASVAFVGWGIAPPAGAPRAVVARIELDEIHRRTSRDAGGLDYAAIVFGRTGIVLTTDPLDPTMIGQRPGLEHPLAGLLNTMIEGTASGRDAAGVERIFAFTQMPETGAKIAVAMAREDIIGDEQRATTRLVAILLAVAVLAMAVGWVVAELWVTRSVVALTRSADAFREGDLDHRAAAPGRVPELVKLADAFNRMAAELGVRHRDLESARAALEARRAALEASEQRFRDIAEVAGDFFWERAPDGRYVFASERFEEVTGVPPDLILGKRAEERAGLVADGPDAALLREAFAARHPFRNLTLRMTLPSGEIRWWRMSGKPVVEAGTGRFLGFRGAGNEVTAAKQAEAELFQAKEAAEAASRLVEAANHELERRVRERTDELDAAQGELLRKERLSTLGQLTATVAHELRNPLSAIKNTLFTIRELTQSKGLDLKRPLDRVERSIERCNGIITDLLDYSRVRELRATVRVIEPWLADVIAEQTVPASVTVETSFAAEGARVGFEPDRLRRVVINLVDNAVQAMDDAKSGGARKVLRVATSIAAGELHLVLEDSGPGIPPEALDRVFEPLFSTKSFGTGLGLPTARQIVEQHGGTIAIETAFGAGTRVVVRLPLAEEEEKQAA